MAGRPKHLRPVIGCSGSIVGVPMGTYQAAILVGTSGVTGWVLTLVFSDLRYRTS